MNTIDRFDVPTDSILYGDVLISYCDDQICAEYVSEPRNRVTIRRLGPRTRDRVPIGTRTRNRLRADIDGNPVVLIPGRARLVKRSYRVGIEVDDRTLTLAAKDLQTSVLWSGTSDQGDNCFGEFTRLFSGAVEVFWSVPFRFMKKTIEPPVPSQEDVLIGLAVAAAFGTGGLSATTIVMGIVGSIFP